MLILYTKQGKIWSTSDSQLPNSTNYVPRFNLFKTVFFFSFLLANVLQTYSTHIRSSHMPSCQLYIFAVTIIATHFSIVPTIFAVAITQPLLYHSASSYEILSNWLIIFSLLNLNFIYLLKKKWMMTCHIMIAKKKEREKKKHKFFRVLFVQGSHFVGFF